MADTRQCPNFCGLGGSYSAAPAIARPRSASRPHRFWYLHCLRTLSEMQSGRESRSLAGFGCANAPIVVEHRNRMMDDDNALHAEPEPKSETAQLMDFLGFSFASYYGLRLACDPVVEDLGFSV